MKLVTSKDLAKTAASNWKHQYYDPQTGRWHNPLIGSAEEIYNRLLAAKHNVKPWCDECLEYKESVVSFGNEETKEICEDCLRKALSSVRRGVES